jgi:biopolymer transport protein ExbB/biopolymer transport protein TolQ
VQKKGVVIFSVIYVVAFEFASPYLPWGLDETFQYMERLVRWCMVLLCMMFLWARIVIADRVAGYWWARSQSRKFVPEIQGALLDRHFAEAIRICEKRRARHLARVVKVGVQQLYSHRVSVSPTDTASLVDLRMRAEAGKADCELRRGMSALANVAATAPFAGLFGTTIGILDSFRGVGMSHSTVISMMAGTIAEALATTALGMVVAVPAVWGLNYLNDRFEILRIEMSLARSEMVTYAEREGGERRKTS